MRVAAGDVYGARAVASRPLTRITPRMTAPSTPSATPATPATPQKPGKRMSAHASAAAIAKRLLAAPLLHVPALADIPLEARIAFQAHMRQAWMGLLAAS